MNRDRRRTKYRTQHAINHNRKKARRRNLLAGEWRDHPASEKQWKALRRIGRRTGQRFPQNITKGEASDTIRAFHGPSAP